MERGKEICRILKEIRKQIAKANDIEFVTAECRHKGDCAGTCPKCESEVRYLEEQLERRRRLGHVARVAGLAIGLAAVA
ncbi:MAG: energy transducer TonB, partial [Bacteroidales bacterium]|nr:energy transducer TonB [Bacteroidales bacterium]